MSSDTSKAGDVANAVQLFPWAAQVWRRVRELLLEPTNEDGFVRAEVFSELSMLFEKRADEMLTFVQQVLPRAEFPDYWRYVDPAEVYGTPLPEGWWEKTDREMFGSVGANPIRRVFPALRTSSYERTRALKI